MRLIVLGHDQTSARILVEPMHNAGPFLASDPGKRRAMMKQGVDQSVLAMTRARMDDQAGRFVQDDEIIVFEENMQWDRLRPVQARLGRRLAHFDAIARSNLVARPGRFAI